MQPAQADDIHIASAHTLFIGVPRTWAVGAKNMPSQIWVTAPSVDETTLKLLLFSGVPARTEVHLGQTIDPTGARFDYSAGNSRRRSGLD